MPLDELKRLAAAWKAQEGLPGPDVNRLLDAVPELVQEHEQLRAAVLFMLKASEPGVPETAGVGRVARLARLVGYNPGPQDQLGMPPTTRMDVDRMQREMTRLADLLRIEVGETSPGWTFSLLLYLDREDPHNGHVLHVSPDGERALPAIARWVLERLDGRKAKARG